MLVKNELTGDMVDFNKTRITEDGKTIDGDTYRRVSQSLKKPLLTLKEIKDHIKMCKDFTLLVNEIVSLVKARANKDKARPMSVMENYMKMEDDYCVKELKKVRTCLTKEEHMFIMSHFIINDIWSDLDEFRLSTSDLDTRLKELYLDDMVSTD